MAPRARLLCPLPSTCRVPTLLIPPPSSFWSASLSLYPMHGLSPGSSLLPELPKQLPTWSSCLQLVLPHPIYAHTATRVVFLKHKDDHVSPCLKSCNVWPQAYYHPAEQTSESLAWPTRPKLICFLLDPLASPLALPLLPNTHLYITSQLNATTRGS